MMHLALERKVLACSQLGVKYFYLIIRKEYIK